MIRLIPIIIYFIILLPSCSKKHYPEVLIGGHHYVSVMEFGTKANGTTDDRYAIQRAIDSGKDLYFPKGRYLLKSKTNTQALLSIYHKKHPEKLLFAPGAILVVSPGQPKDYIKPAVLQILAEKENIGTVEISGITIEGNRTQHNIENPGIIAFERPGKRIKKLILRDINIRNTGGGGIHTQAEKNYFYNIHTENCGSHGIGIINTTNPGKINEFYLDGYISIDDDAYSIDFSGKKKGKKALPGYGWIGKAKNVVSKRSEYGIKAAGYWHLELENIHIENSKNNGFFINVDAPGSVIKAENMTITNAGGSGLQLQGDTYFEGKKIGVEGCGVAVNIGKANVKIDDLVIDGKNKNTATIRMGASPVEITNFVIRNTAAKDEYPIWICGVKVVLKNGRIENTHGLADIIVHETAGNVLLENIQFSKSSDRSPRKSIVNIQKQGHTKVINCQFQGKNKRIDDRVKRVIQDY